MTVVQGGKTSHQCASAFRPWRGVLAEATIERSIFKMLTGTPLHVRSENSCSNLYWLGAAATNLRHYLVKGVIYLLLYWSSLIDLGNQDENLYLGRLWSDVMMMAQGRLLLLEGVAAEEVDLVVSVYFISYNGSGTGCL